MRKTKRTDEAVYKMAVSIHHQGVLQNLLLEAEFDGDEWTGRFGVVGGETRRLALCRLRDGGVQDAIGYTDDFEVSGLIVASPEADHERQEKLWKAGARYRRSNCCNFIAVCSAATINTVGGRLQRQMHFNSGVHRAKHLLRSWPVASCAVAAESALR